MKIFGTSAPLDSFSFELPQSKSQILEKLEEKIKNHKPGWQQVIGLDRKYIDYARFKIEEERIVVKSNTKSRPAPIYIYLEEGSGGKTTMRVEQKNSVARSKTILVVFFVIMFVLLFTINVSTGNLSIGANLLITLIPLVTFGLILGILFYFLEKLQKNYLRQFAKLVVRTLG